MDKYAKLNEVFKNAFGNKAGMQIMAGAVVEITGDTCRVALNADLTLSDVRLKISIGDSGDFLVIYPVLNSLVLMGSLSGDLKDLAVIKCQNIERIEYQQDGLKLKIDSTDRKISVANDEVSLIGLFQGLTDLLKGFKVFTPAGPSGTPLPPTILALNEFETNFKKLLK